MLPRTLLVACALAAAPSVARADLKVVATVPDLAALAKEIGGARADVSAIALPTQDPHFVDARPSLLVTLSKADLLLAVGLDLEVGWLPTLQVGARNAKIQAGARGFLDCSTLVSLLEVPTQKVDRSMGDIHPGGNPHYFYDPRSGVALARGIATRMAELDPPNRDHYLDRGKGVAERLEAAIAGWEKRLAPLRGTPIITYHRSWTYFAAWLGLEQVEWLEPKPGIAPNPTHVAHVLATARARKVRLILQETYFPDNLTRLLADKIPARVVRVPAGAAYASGQTYQARIEALVTALARELGR